MIEFRVVRGIWPSPASRAPILNAAHEGTYILGCQIWREGKLRGPVMKSERMIPRMKTRRAYGTFVVFCVRSSARNAKIAHTRLSQACGVVHPRG
jgi:hypothetical protein